MHKIGIQTANIIEDEAPETGFRRIANAGFDCVDFSLDTYLRYEEFAPDYSGRFFDKSLDELFDFFTPHKNAAKSLNIKINQMHMPYPMFATNISREANEYIRYQVLPKFMEICAFLECHNIVAHLFNLPNTVPDKACALEQEGIEWRANSEVLHELAPFAAKRGITISLENLYKPGQRRLSEGPCCDPVKLTARIDYFNAKYKSEVLGACFDTGHANLTDMDMASYLKILGHRVKTLHIHDNDCMTDLHQIPYTFTNTRDKICSTNWDEFLRTLKAIGFTGVLSFETAPALKAFPQELADDVLCFIASIGKYFAQELDNAKLM